MLYPDAAAMDCFAALAMTGLIAMLTTLRSSSWPEKAGPAMT